MPDMLASLDSAFAKSALQKSYVVYRGIDPAAEASLSALKPGQVISIPAFISASASLRYANNLKVNLMRIVLNVGTPAISMSVISRIPGEVLLNRDQQLIFDGIGLAGEYKFHTPEKSSKPGASAPPNASSINEAQDD
jgi:hypothetical protein